MKYAVEMGGVAMMYIPSFIKIGSGIKNLIGVIHRHTGWRPHKPAFIFQNKESKLKNVSCYKTIFAGCIESCVLPVHHYLIMIVTLRIVHAISCSGDELSCCISLHSVLRRVQ
jgi:hypothetical protein